MESRNDPGEGSFRDMTRRSDEGEGVRAHRLLAASGIVWRSKWRHMLVCWHRVGGYA